MNASSGQLPSDRASDRPTGLPADFGHALPATPSLTHDDGEYLARISGEALALGGPGRAPGERPVHPTGVYAQGWFVADPGADATTSAEHLRAGARTRVLARFSHSSPRTPRDDRNLGQHGMAVRFDVPSGAPVDMVAMDLDRFYVRDRAAFEAASLAMARGRIQPIWRVPLLVLVRRIPPSMAIRLVDLRRPRSYALRTYYGINAFVWRSATSRATTIRFRWRATGADVGIRRRQQTPTYLRDELRARLANGVATTFVLEVQHGDGVDPRRRLDATKRWRVDWQTVGELTFDGVVTDRNDISRLDARSYSPLHLCPGIEPHPGDAILALRAAAYPASHVVRTLDAP